ncbi:MAG: cation acetate symporter [Phycisphaerales bacterium]|nr:cation acetate symporter [Phycisphaerales bacterium]
MLGRRAKGAQGYFAAHGQVGWFVNGIAFAGDYLSAASFLGICGLIAFWGYDGFLYSIGYLAGWIVALLVVAEPIRRLGRYTFADALNARFGSRTVTVAAGVSTLLVSLFYLVPQMVGAGALITPLLGVPHWVGVVLVGAVVTFIVATAGMVSTTWVQFIKGGLLLALCTVLVGLILGRGFEVRDPGPARDAPARGVGSVTALPAWAVPGEGSDAAPGPDGMVRTEGARTGPLGPIEFLRVFSASEVAAWRIAKDPTPDGATRSIARPERIAGSDLLLPGNSPTFRGLRSGSVMDRVDFASLMLALFLGTASLPHILIRYYTVKDVRSARLSTVVGIGAIGGFYVLTLYLGLGAMTGGNLDTGDSNMSAPLLARSFGSVLFALISSVAFFTVLGTVSGLVLAGSGAVARDLVTTAIGRMPDERSQVRIARIAAVALGAGAMLLGFLFRDLNASFLVGWAFNVAASANLPALVMALFWKRATAAGVSAAIITGLVSSLAWVLVSKDACEKVYGLPGADALAPFSQPAIVTIPLSAAVGVAVSLLARRA